MSALSEEIIYAHLFLAESPQEEYRRLRVSELRPRMEAYDEAVPRADYTGQSTPSAADMPRRRSFGLRSFFRFGGYLHGHYYENYHGPVREQKL